LDHAAPFREIVARHRTRDSPRLNPGTVVLRATLPDLPSRARLVQPEGDGVTRELEAMSAPSAPVYVDASVRARTTPRRCVFEEEARRVRGGGTTCSKRRHDVFEEGARGRRGDVGVSRLTVLPRVAHRGDAWA
jgi:hypothetical protein